jgi:5-methylthioadenosine/S-adenosylhomocysteine deaminase
MMSDSLKIIANGYVVTCDPGNRGGRYNLLIRGGRIIEISDSLDLFTSLHPYATVIDATDKLILPGFVNAHVHSESILLRELTQDLHFSLWKKNIHLAASTALLNNPENHEDVLSVMLTAYFGHLKAGSTLVGEYGPDVKEPGFAALLQALERSDVKSVVALQNWDQISHVRDLGPNRPRCMVSLGSEEEFTVYSFESAVRVARELDVPIVAHVGEQRESVETVRRNFQKDILAVLSGFNALKPSTLLVHANHLHGRELQTIEQIPLTPVVCARSALYKQTGYPVLRRLMGRTFRLCVGTDWGRIDVLGELQFLDQLPRLVPGMQRLSPLELLRMGTINGAYALGQASDAGSIETGKRADLTFWNVKGLRLPPLSPYAAANELAAFLINYLNTEDITDVMIDGDFYVVNRQCVTMLEDDIIEGLRKTWEKFFPEPPGTRTGAVPSAWSTAESALQARPKVLPFVSPERPAPAIPTGYEEGFPIEGKPLPEGDEDKSTASIGSPEISNDRTEMPTNLPELPKDVKRVFGEDEDS